MAEQDIAGALVERLEPIIEQLDRRMEGDLSPRSNLAVQTALHRALVSGMQFGFDALAEWLAENGVPIEADIFGHLDYDAYAAEYEDRDLAGVSPLLPGGSRVGLAAPSPAGPPPGR